jgi:tetratricopeptide (TPR) repeat protein
MPERHRSLRATFDHSWKLLSDHEKDALARLSVFRGGFDRNAAEKVAGATLPLLASLVSKSLVRRTEKGRYDLHEVIRQYASSHLDEDQARCLETCNRHSEYYLNFASEYERRLKSASQQAAIREMTIELDNMRTAWNWGITHGKFESLGRAVRSFGWFFEIASLLREGIEQLELLVQALSTEPPDTQKDRVLGSTFVQQGLLYFRTGQFIRAHEVYEESIAMLRSVGEQTLLADALIFDGIIMHLNGDYLESKEMIKEGLAYAQATNDPWFTAYAMYGLGHVDSLLGEYEKGYEQMQAGLKIWRRVGDPHSITLGLNFLVSTLIKLERYEEAVASMRESISLCKQTKNRWGMGTAYRYLGLATMAGGQYVEAQGHFQKSLEIFGEYFEGWDIALSLIYLGDATLMSGDLAGAESIYLDALRLAKETRSMSLMLDALAGLSLFDVRSGKSERAWELSYTILNHPSSAQETKDRASQVIAEAEHRLNNQQVQAIKERVSSQSLEEMAETFVKAKLTA